MSARGLRPLRWTDVPRAARMTASAYMEKPLPDGGPRMRMVVTAAAAVTFALSLAIYRPLVRYWIDPEDNRRQTAIAVTPRGRMIVPMLRLVLGLALCAALVLGPELDPATDVARIALGVLSLLALTAGGWTRLVRRSGEPGVKPRRDRCWAWQRDLWPTCSNAPGVG